MPLIWGTLVFLSGSSFSKAKLLRAAGLNIFKIPKFYRIRIQTIQSPGTKFFLYQNIRELNFK